MAISINWGTALMNASANPCDARVSGIYAICNTTNGKYYVGSAKELRHRWNCHLFLLRRGRHHSPHLQAAWNKYGHDAFTLCILESCDPCDLLRREQVYLDALRPPYNVGKTASSRLGQKASDETRAKLSALRRGRALWTDEQKQEISRRLLGHPVSDEARAKMSQSRLGKIGPRRGMKNSHEAIAKMRAALRGRKSPQAKRVLFSGIIYESAVAAANAIGVSPTCLRAMLRGQNPNKFNATYVQ